MGPNSGSGFRLRSIIAQDGLRLGFLAVDYWVFRLHGMIICRVDS